MRIRHFLIIVLGVLVCMLLLDDLVPQPFVTRDSGVVYAMGSHHHHHHRRAAGNSGVVGNLGEGNSGVSNFDSGPPNSVPEPATLALLGAGLLGLATGYWRRKFLKR